MTANDSPPDSDVGARTLAAANLDRMHQVLDVAMKSGQSSLSAARANGVRANKLAIETTTRTIAYSQAAAAASTEHLTRLMQIRDFKEAADLQAEFVRSRLAAFQDYLRDISKTAETALLDPTSE